jgi:hypothetical protein
MKQVGRVEIPQEAFWRCCGCATRPRKNFWIMLCRGKNTGKSWDCSGTRLQLKSQASVQTKEARSPSRASIPKPPGRVGIGLLFAVLLSKRSKSSAR